MHICTGCTIRKDTPCLLISLDPGQETPDRCPWNGFETPKWMPLKNAPDETYDAVNKFFRQDTTLMQRLMQRLMQ